MSFLPLLLIPSLFGLVVFAKARVGNRTVVPLCALCIAVASTWLLLLLGSSFGVSVSPTLIALLIGMSITGVTYKLESIYTRRHIRNFWFVRLVLVLGGLYTAWLGFESQIGSALLIAVVSFFAVTIATFFFQHDMEPSSARHHLDNCC